MTIIIALLAGGCGTMGFLFAAGAPQQAAAAAGACLWVIAAYVITRAVDELTRG